MAKRGYEIREKIKAAEELGEDLEQIHKKKTNKLSMVLADRIDFQCSICFQFLIFFSPPSCCVFFFPITTHLLTLSLAKAARKTNNARPKGGNKCWT
jgi:hypothetical protein